MSRDPISDRNGQSGQASEESHLLRSSWMADEPPGRGSRLGHIICKVVSEQVEPWVKTLEYEFFMYYYFHMGLRFQVGSCCYS